MYYLAYKHKVARHPKSIDIPSEYYSIVPITDDDALLYKMKGAFVYSSDETPPNLATLWSEFKNFYNQGIPYVEFDSL